MTPTAADRYPVVYLIRCLVNGKLYVGSAKDFYKRYTHYKSRAKYPSTPIEKAMHKHGLSNFDFTVLEVLATTDKATLIAREQFWLDNVSPFTLTKKGYNVCEIAYSCQGVKHSAESCQRLSQAKRKQAETTARRVLQIDPQTLQVKTEHISCGRAAEAFGLSEQSIRGVCDGQYLTAGGFTWCYKDLYDPSSFRLRKRMRRGGPLNGQKAKPVIQMTMDGETIRVWDHARVAASTLKIGLPGIYSACIGKASCAFGFKWAYSDDPILIEAVNRRRKEAWCLANNLPMPVGV